MSQLRDLQWLLLRCIAKTVTWCEENGYVLTGKELLRTPEQAALNAANGSGVVHSLHLNGLAIDMIVFKDGVMAETVDDFRPVGEFWKTLDPLCCWGGDFTTRPDADHFSITWMGIR